MSWLLNLCTTAATESSLKFMLCTYVFGFCEEKSMTPETLHYYFSILNQNPTNPTDFHLSAKIVSICTIMIFGKCLLGLLKVWNSKVWNFQALVSFLFRIKMYRSSIPIDLEDSDRAFSYVYFIIVLYILISVNQKWKIFVIKQLFL